MTKQFLEHGDKVIGTVRDLNKVADLLEKYPDTFFSEVLDVTNVKAIQELLDLSFIKHETIDVIISNAGYGLFGAAEELSDEEVNHMIATNLMGSIQLIRAAIPHLRTQGGEEGLFRFLLMVDRLHFLVIPCITIVEPGGARTEFRYGSAKVAKLMPEYDGNPAHAFLNMLDASKVLAPGDPVKMAARMADFKSQKELAASTDFLAEEYFSN